MAAPENESARGQGGRRDAAGTGLRHDYTATAASMSSALHRRSGRKVLPAFGRELLELRRRGLVPQRHLAVGHVLVLLDHWQWGRCYESQLARLVIAKDAEPARLDFSGAAGLDVSLVWSMRYSSPERFAAARDALLAFLPGALQVFEMDCEPTPERWYVIRLDAQRRAA